MPSQLCFVCRATGLASVLRVFGATSVLDRADTVVDGLKAIVKAVAINDQGNRVKKFVTKF